MKYRKALLDGEVVRIILETAKGIEERYDIEFETIGCDKDQVHIVCSGHPKIAPGQTDGYSVAPVGERGNWRGVETYVKKQGKPKEELRQFKLF